MMHKILTLNALILFSICLIACNASSDKKKAKNNSIYPQNFTFELSEEQEDALDAFNKIQTNTDQKNHFYSTFPNIDLPCIPTDTSYTISQTEFLSYMQAFVTELCQQTDSLTRIQWATASVLAQPEYTVLHCSDQETKALLKDTLSMSGIWVLPSILGRRDVHIVW